MGVTVITVSISCDACKAVISSPAKVLDACYYGRILCMSCYESMSLEKWFKMIGDNNKNAVVRDWHDMADRV